MFNVLTLNKIAKCGLDNLDSSKYTITDDASANADAIVLRSFAMHDMELPSNLKAVARAGAGVNNIPIDKCSEKGIVVFNTPGANANAVKELVIAGLFLVSRNVVGGIEWAKTLTGDDVAKQVEKGKSAFVGPEIEGKKLGVIGLGAIGVMVANAAHHLGMDVIGYDPFISVDSAWSLSRYVRKAEDINEIYSECDYITMHLPLNDSTRGMINDTTISAMKDGVRLLNFARGELVDVDSLKKAIDSGKIAAYITDFPNAEVVKMDKVIPIPHLGASTPESEDNCAVMACKELADFLETGNISHSVNFPECSLAMGENGRLAITHKNIVNMLSRFSAFFSEVGINISDMINKSKKDLAYTIMNVDGTITDDIIKKISEIDGVLGVRVIK